MALWTIAHQAPLSMGILQAKVPEWVAMPSSKGSSQPRSAAFQADSLPSESPEKILILEKYVKSLLFLKVCFYQCLLYIVCNVHFIQLFGA